VALSANFEVLLRPECTSAIGCVATFVGTNTSTASFMEGPLKTPALKPWAEWRSLSKGKLHFSHQLTQTMG